MNHRLAAAHPAPVRVVPWPGDRATVQLLPSLTSRLTDPTELQPVIQGLQPHVCRVLTAALDREAAVAYAAAGFQVRSRLVLLRRDITGRIPVRTKTDRALRRQWDQLATIDRAAFGPFWGFDVAAIERAVTATTSRRVRRLGDGPDAYAITGVAGDYGYLQRLAVHPDHWGEGLGTALVHDSLAWMRRSGAHTAVVNTEDDNQRALALYRGTGFTSLAEGLCIMELSR